jgi:hypothetical protein
MAYFRQYLAAENNLAIFRHFRGGGKNSSIFGGQKLSAANGNNFWRLVL